MFRKKIHQWRPKEGWVFEVSRTIHLDIRNSSNYGITSLTGLTYNSSGLEIYYQTYYSKHKINLLPLESPYDSYKPCGFIEVPICAGLCMYRLDLPPEISYVSSAVFLVAEGASNMMPCIRVIRNEWNQTRRICFYQTNNMDRWWWVCVSEIYHQRRQYHQCYNAW